MELITEWLQMYYEATKSNPLLAAVAIPVVGVLTYAAKSVPMRVMQFFWRRITVTLTMNNAGYDGNLDAFHAFDKWFMESNWVSTSRSFFLFRQYRHNLVEGESYKPYRLGVGGGTHLFVYRNRIYWFNKSKLDSSGSERQKEEITVRTFGFRINAFSELVDIFNDREAEGQKISIARFSDKDKEWQKVVDLVPRDLSTVAIDPNIKNDIVGKIEQFMRDKARYRQKGLTYKISFIFHGEPGTGKTALVRALATHFNKDLYELDLNCLTDLGMLNALARVKPGAIVLVEDIDAAGNAVKNREARASENSLSLDYNPLTLKGILNSLDGIVGLDNVILIATTNHLDHLDSALTRTSRFDHKYEFRHMTYDRIVEYASLMFERDVTADPDVHPFLEQLRQLGGKPLISGSDVECLYKTHIDYAAEFFRALLAEIRKPTLRVLDSRLRNFVPSIVATQPLEEVTE